jgi:hypothetical protein
VRFPFLLVFVLRNGADCDAVEQSPELYVTLDSDKFQLPTILSRGMINPKEVGELFGTYFDKMNVRLSLSF